MVAASAMPKTSAASKWLPPPPKRRAHDPPNASYFPKAANPANMVGRTPRSARDAFVPPPEQRHPYHTVRKRPTGASAADRGVRPTFAPTRVLSVSVHLPESSAGTRSLARIALASTYPTNFFPTLTPPHIRESSARKPSRAHSASPPISPTPSCNQNHPAAILFDTISPPTIHS